MSAKVIPLHPTAPEPSAVQEAPRKQPKAKIKTTPSGEGHRERLKEKFADGTGTGLADYELLELALTYAIPRKDVKPIAKALLKRFSTLHGVLGASGEDLRTIEGMGRHSAALIQLTGTLARRIGKEKLDKLPLTNKLALYEYLYTLFAGKTREEVHVLYLDTQHQLITEETLFLGTLTQSAASPRDLLKRALSHNAAGLIIAHNHPSGIPTPSKADHEFTQALLLACHNLGLALHDHLIVGTDQIYSFKSAGHC